MRLRILTAVLTFAAVAPGQNLVTNPGFDQNTKGWAFSATLRNPRLATTTVTGTTSTALRFEHNSGTALATLHQQLALNAGLHRLRLFAGAELPPASTVVVKAWLVNLRTNQWHLGARGDLRNRTNKKKYFEVAIDQLPKLPITKDSYLLKIEFLHLGSANLQPATCDIDGIELATARFPITSLDQVSSTAIDRAIISTLTESSHSLVTQTLGLKRLGKSISIPGIGGALELDPLAMVVFPAAWRNGQNWHTRLPVWPSSAKGLHFFAQSMSVHGLTLKATLGSSTWHAIH
jgi:hypothetical protein